MTARDDYLYGQAQAFLEWEVRLPVRTKSSASIRERFEWWYESKMLNEDEAKAIWLICKYALYSKSGTYRFPQRRVRMVNQHRKKRMRRDPETGHVHTYGAYHRWIKGKNCEVVVIGNRQSDCEGKVTGHHMKTVGSGGRDFGNEVPLCNRHHKLIEDEGASAFQKKTGVNPFGSARYWAQRWTREQRKTT